MIEPVKPKRGFFDDVGDDIGDFFDHVGCDEGALFGGQCGCPGVEC